MTTREAIASAGIELRSGVRRSLWRCRRRKGLARHQSVHRRLDDRTSCLNRRRGNPGGDRNKHRSGNQAGAAGQRSGGRNIVVFCRQRDADDRYRPIGKRIGSSLGNAPAFRFEWLMREGDQHERQRAEQTHPNPPVLFSQASHLYSGIRHRTAGRCCLSGTLLNRIPASPPIVSAARLSPKRRGCLGPLASVPVGMLHRARTPAILRSYPSPPNLRPCSRSRSQVERGGNSYVPGRGVAGRWKPCALPALRL
jgi:hypothetical protein